jgi:myosin protein heavy chain
VLRSGHHNLYPLTVLKEEEENETAADEDINHNDHDNDEDDEAMTLVGIELKEGEEVKLREGDVIKEIEVSDDDDDESVDERLQRMDSGCGVKRRRTIRVVIRSRAFL